MLVEHGWLTTCGDFSPGRRPLPLGESSEARDGLIRLRPVQSQSATSADKVSTVLVRYSRTVVDWVPLPGSGPTGAARRRLGALAPLHVDRSAIHAAGHRRRVCRSRTLAIESD